MAMQQQFVILVAGNTHTGKSTFARKIHRWLPNTELIEADQIARFLYHNHPDLQLCERVSRYGWHDPKLKLTIYFSIIRAALSCGKNILLTNNNTRLKWRRRLLGVVNQFKVRTILVFIDLPHWLLLKRIARTKKNTEALFKCHSYRELLIQHSPRVDKPSVDEVDHLFIVRKVAALSAIERKLKRLVRSWGYTV